MVAGIQARWRLARVGYCRSTGVYKSSSSRRKKASFGTSFTQRPQLADVGKSALVLVQEESTSRHSSGNPYIESKTNERGKFRRGVGDKKQCGDYPPGHVAIADRVSCSGVFKSFLGEVLNLAWRGDMMAL